MKKQLIDESIYVGEIKVNQNVKKIYKTILGHNYSDTFFISDRQLKHIQFNHPEINFFDIAFCINNPNFICKIKNKEQINIISYLGDYKYIYILVDVKINKENNSVFNKKGILSARYINNKKFSNEITKNILIYVNIENIKSNSI